MGPARRWAIAAAGFLVAAAVVAVAFPLYVRSTESRRWEEMRRWCEKTADEARARDPRRPVLRGQPVEGNAWDDYKAAAAAIGLPKDLEAAARLLDEVPKTDAAKVRSLVQLHAPALQTLRRGTTRSFARRDVNWEGGESSYSMAAYRICSLAVCQARFLIEDGQAHEGMEALLDAGQYAEDQGFNGTSMDGLGAIALLRYVQDELARVLRSGALSSEDCRQMARELEVLDGNFPREADGLPLEAMTSGFLYLRKDSLKEFAESIGITRPIKPTWRYGFSERLVFVDTFQTEVEGARRLTQAAGLPWKEAKRIQEDLHATEKLTLNPLMKEFSIINDALYSPPTRNLHRERRAQLHLLRGAAHFRATGQILTLEDPYGNKILSSLSGSHLKLWSVGADAVDDGGTGEWKVRQGKDIVLELDR